MANLGVVSTINVNGNDMTIKDAALTSVVDDIIEAIGENNGAIGSRINDLNNRSFDGLIKISSNNDSEISNILDGIYKIQYVIVTGEGDNAIETLNNSAILIQDGNNQYILKNGQISSRIKTNNTWGNWVNNSVPVTSVNGMTGAVNIQGLPTVTASDNGKILMVVNGAWTLASPSALYTGTGLPNNANGNNGDIYVQQNE